MQKSQSLDQLLSNISRKKEEEDDDGSMIKSTLSSGLKSKVSTLEIQSKKEEEDDDGSMIKSTLSSGLKSKVSTLEIQSKKEEEDDSFEATPAHNTHAGKKCIIDLTLSDNDSNTETENENENDSTSPAWLCGSNVSNTLIGSSKTSAFTSTLTLMGKKEEDDTANAINTSLPRIAPTGYAWLCDKCQVVEFCTLDEATAHEKTCSIPDSIMEPPAKRSKPDTTGVNGQVNDSIEV